MIQVVTNSLGSGDWITVIDSNKGEIWSGHSIKANDLVQILKPLLGVRRGPIDLVEITDEQMEEEFS